MPTKARIQQVRSLSDKAARSLSGLFVVEGRKMVEEAVAAGAAIEAIYFTRESGLPKRWNSVKEEIAENVSPKEMERMSHLKTPPEVLAVIRIPDYSERCDSCRGLSLCLDGVQDPGNLGTIIRTADWFGIDRIWCSPDSADCYNPKVVQATMGAIFRVKVAYSPLPEVLRGAAERGANIYGTFLEGEDLYSSELSEAGILVMGSEGRGISPAVASCVNRKLYISPYPSGSSGSESLNVAVATAIVCSEFRRRIK